jgi:hypothetical protein
LHFPKTKSERSVSKEDATKFAGRHAISRQSDCKIHDSTISTIRLKERNYSRKYADKGDTIMTPELIESTEAREHGIFH